MTEAQLRVTVGDPRVELPGAKLVSTLYVWFVCTSLSGLGTLALTRQPQALYLFGAIVAFATLGAVCGSFLRDESKIRALSLLIFVGFALLPSAVLGNLSAEQGVFLHLYFVLLVSTPALLRLWSLHIQALSGVLAVVTASIFWLPNDPWAAAQSFFLVLASSGLACIVATNRAPSRLGSFFSVEVEAVEHLQVLENQELPSRVWSTLLLQTVLLVLLLFLGVGFGSGELAKQLLMIGNACFVMVLAALALRAAPSRFSGAILVVSTAAVGITISIAQLSLPATGEISRLLPLLYLTFSTSTLPWKLQYQIVVAWLLALSGILSGALRVGLDAPSEVLVDVMSRMSGGLALLILGGIASVITAQFLRQRKLLTVTQTLSSDVLAHEALVDEEEGGVPAARIFLPSSQGLQQRFFSHLTRGLLVLGIVSNSFASLFLLDDPVPPALLIFFGWSVFGALWSALAWNVRRRGAREEYWLFGAVIALLLLIWPSTILIMGSDNERYWLLWPVIVLFGLGGVPWRVSELLPLMALSILVSFAMIDHFQVEALGVILLCAPVVVGLVMTKQHSANVKESYFLTHFEMLLSETNSQAQCLRTYALVLLSVLGQDTAILKRHDGKCEVLRGNRSFELTEGRWPHREFQAIERMVPPVREGYALSILNWLTAPLAFFDPRFGFVSAVHGIFIEIVPRIPDLPAESELPTTTLILQRDRLQVQMSIFLPLLFPLSAWFYASELRLTRTLGSLFRLRFESLLEHQRGILRARSSETVLAEREYELSTLVHDINNTVQDLMLLCDDIVDDDGDEEKPGPDTAEQVRRISVLARSMATVVSDAKRRRELERFKDLSPREFVEVTSVVQELVSFAAVRAERKRIRVNAPAPVPEEVFVKVSAREHLETILRNLLDNSVTYSDPGREISVQMRVTPEWVWIDVEDDGPGLTPEQCESVFQMRKPSSQPRTTGGLGIGLAHSRRVAESAGGTLTATSPGPGLGSTFTLCLPRAQRAEHKEPGVSWALIVDDQPALTEVYGKIVRALRLTPYIAGSVQEALTHLGEHGKPSFVVTDLHLGNSSGFELIEHLRREFEPSLPILVVSGMSDLDVEDRARRAGATDFIAKPVARRALYARIESLLANR